MTQLKEKEVYELFPLYKAARLSHTQLGAGDSTSALHKKAIK